MDYLKLQKQQWESGYFAPNVESTVFRFYGRILSRDFGITGDQGERVLDFGCGQGAAVNYFHTLGFSAFGVDISEPDIGVGRNRYPYLARRLAVVDPKPREDLEIFGGGFSCVIAVQALYYLNDPDMQAALRCLHRNLVPGGVIYATMISPRHMLYDHSSETEEGIRVVRYDHPRDGKAQYYINFTESEAELVEKFSLFEPVHVGFYSERYRQDEGERHHYTLVAVKR